MNKKITAIYLRVSNKNGQKFDSQKEELDRWVEVYKPKNVRWYKDKFTGKTMERPGMQKLMEDLHKNLLDSIIVYRLDRLGRSAAGLTKLFEELLQFQAFESLALKRIRIQLLKDGTRLLPLAVLHFNLGLLRLLEVSAKALP